MKERPILFSAPMVRALLDGRKTQTRRMVKPQPTKLGDRTMFGGAMVLDEATLRTMFCPYGAPGDRLWVRETWKVSSESNHYPTDEKRLYVEYRAGAVAGTGQQQSKFSIQRDGELARAAWGKGKASSWRPSIFMPRWASRITLEVTGVRVERLQAITDEDAKAEGCNGFDPEPAAEGGTIYYRPGISGAPDPRAHFRVLWESINGAESWAANPWVWVVEFRRPMDEEARRV